MFGRYELQPPSNDENDTESWSFPSNYERFSTVNVPRSRLGKRRTIDASSTVKRAVLKGVSADPSDSTQLDSENSAKNSCSQNASLTHPVNSSFTPSHKISSFKNHNLQSICIQETKGGNKRNIDCLTPFRKESQPLQEIKNVLNEQKLTPDSGKSPPSLKPLISVSQAGNINSEICTALNKSFEVTEDSNNEIVPYYGAVSITESHGDSVHSDIVNNSSFMTAHDIYNTENNRVHCDSLYAKTPRTGFSLLDMLASPVAPINNVSIQNENETLRSFFSRTPGFKNPESFKTPFRPNTRIERYAAEMFTPTLKNNPRTPMVRDNGLKTLSSNIETKSDEFDPSNKISSFESKIMKNENIVENQQSSVPDSNSFFKTSVAEENNMLNSPSEKSSSSFEIKVKRRIFEGLGWSLPPSSFSPDMKLSVYQPKEKEISSVLLTPNNSSNESSKFVDECNINSTELEVDLNYINTALESQCGITPDFSATMKEGMQPSRGNECTDLPDGFKCDFPELSQPSLNTVLECFKDTDGATEDTRKLNNVMNVSKSLPIDASVSKISDVQMSECDPFPATPMETSSTIPKDNNETEMVTVQNIPYLEEQIAKDETIIPQHSNRPNQVTANKMSSPAQRPSIGSDNKGKQISEKPKCEKEQELVVPGNPSSQNVMLQCPRQVVKPHTNVVYVNKKPYTVLSMLGRGGSSEVYQVLDAESSKLMAMKFVNLASVEESIATGYLNEIEVLTKLQGCPSVIRMFDSEYIPESKILYVVMEKGDTDFSRLMKDIMKTKKISMSMIIYYWTEMLSCVKDIHEKGIIHSDLKPANFLLVSGRLKLIDFGIASSLQGDMTSVHKDVTTGTFNYMSPEAIRNSGETRGYKITYKSDIWSLGCILYNLLYGRTPFSHLTNTWTKLVAIADQETTVSFPTDSSAPPHLMFSVRWALKKDPKERPTASELLKLAELTPGPESKLGRQISTLLAEYISQTFPNCTVNLESKNQSKDKQF